MLQAWCCKGLSSNRAAKLNRFSTRQIVVPAGVAGWLALLLLLAVPAPAAAHGTTTDAYAGPLKLRGASAFGPGASRASVGAYAVDFTNLARTAAPYGAVLPFNNCTPLSTLPCTDLVVNTATPFVLDFNGTEGGLPDRAGAGTGFRMADPPSARLTVDGPVSNPAVPGYEPSRLQVLNGRLNVTANRGIAFLTSAQTLRTNSQLNALGVGVDANARRLSVETTIVSPFMGDKSQQAGLWYGLNEDNFVKLAVVNGTVEMRRELNGQSILVAPNPDYATTAVIPNLGASTVRLRFQLDNVAKTIRGFYSINGGAEVQVGGTGFAPAVPGLFAGRTVGSTPGISFAGIYTTYRNMGDPNFTAVPAGVPVYAFEDFRVQSAEPVSNTLAFSPASLGYTVTQGGSAAPRTATLSASAGTPAVTLTKSANSNWLTTPAGGLGALSFGVNASGLTPGVYNATVTASATGYANAVLPVTLTVEAAPATTGLIRVNFQDPPTLPPAGWLRDYGMPFGPRTITEQATPAGSPTYAYGWKRRTDGTPLDLASAGATPGNGRNRIAGTQYDNATEDVKVKATLMHMQANDLPGFNGTTIEGYWEMSIPNGTYDVTVSTGDYGIPTSTEIHTLNVEGKNAINAFVSSGEMGAETRFAAATVRVTVADGALTINANETIEGTLYKGTNAKITGVQIRPATALPYLYWSASTQSVVIEANTAETSKTFAVELSRSDNREAVQMNLSAAYSSGGSGWLAFNAVHNGSEPSVTFDYTAAKSLPVGTHTATVTASAAGYSSATITVQVTVGAAGTIRPYVVASTPTDGATNVSLSPTIAANSLYVPNVPGFKGGVDNSTITTSTVRLLKVAGGTTTEMLGTVQGTGGGDAISFTPTYALEPFTLYKFMITEGVKSHSGASFQPYEAFFTTGAPTGSGGNLAVEFRKSPIPGTQNKKYTSITFGPDGKFYALRLDGTIERYTVDRTTGQLSGLEEIQTLITRHGSRSAVGLAFDPSSTAENLVAWVSHCSAGLDNAPLFDGNLSRLSGPSLGTEQHVLTKLPRSMKDHLVNSIVFGPDRALYFNQGSNSSMGIYDNTWKRDESLLAAAVLRLDLNKLNGLTLPLNVETSGSQAAINAASSTSMTTSDGKYNPYAANAPLTIYASGVRNAYDLVWHSNGHLYVPANGSAAGGNSPASVAGTRRPNGTFYNGPAIPRTEAINVQKDWLFRINPLRPVGYYGHPNPLRGEYVAHRGSVDNLKYPDGIMPDANYRGSAFDFEFNKSPNGALEYKSSAFNGALKGWLLVCRFSGSSDIIALKPGTLVPVSGMTATSDDKVFDIVESRSGSGTNGIPGMAGFANPLDITEDVQTGNLYVIEFNWNNDPALTSQITLLRATTPTAPAGIASVSPGRVVDNAVTGTNGRNQTVTIANTGNGPLKVTGIQLGGLNAAQFQLLGIQTLPTATAPLTIATNSATTFNVLFKPASTGTKVATLTVTSEGNASKTVALNGLATAGIGGTNEPSLKAILDVYGIPVAVGDDNKNTNIIHSVNFKAPLLGEEVRVQQFERATDGNVLIEPLAVFGPQHSAGVVTAFGWYESGNRDATRQLFTVGNNDFQTVNVQPSGALSFNPGLASFGFYSRWPFFGNRQVYSEDALNTFAGAIPHHVRVYRLRDAANAVVPNSYIVAMEEHVDGFDYQDIVVIVRNVRPAGQDIAQQLQFASPQLSFSLAQGSLAPPQTIALTATTGSPAVTLTKPAGAEWLILPENPTLGNLTFGVDAGLLAPGTYSVPVTATASGYQSAFLTVNLSVTGTSPTGVKINFQAVGTTATPTGYQKDVGGPYSDTRGFGWIDAATRLARDYSTFSRERATSDELRLRTFMQMQPAGQPAGAWEYKVAAAGTYNVTVSVGDPSFGDSNHSLNVEGTPAITGFVPNLAVSGGAFRSATVTVPVTDGRLTIDASGGTNTKINYVVIELANAESDFTPPEANVQVQGTQQEPGVYANQAVVTISATDVGGAGVQTTQYSLNSSTYTAYSGPVTVSTAGTYSLRAKVTDGNNNITTTDPVNFSVVTASTVSLPKLVIDNLDKYPAADQLTFSLIREPWRRTEPTVTPYNANHDTVTLRLYNRGEGALRINNLVFSRPNSYRIRQVITPGGVATAYNASTSLPITVNPGANSYVDLVVSFVNDPALAVTRVRVLHDKLTISSNDPGLATKDILLHALLQNRGEGSNEPTAREIIDAFGLKTRTGFTMIAPNKGQTVVAASEEVVAPYFVVADPTRNVYVRYLGAYHGCCDATEAMRWFLKGNNRGSSNPVVVSHIGLDGQSLLPRRGLPNVPSESGAFKPTGAFSFMVSSSYLDKSLQNFPNQPADNTAQGFKVWKAVDINGNVIPNAYILGHDYLGQPGITNYDYQDNVFFVGNVRPETGPVHFSELAAAPSAVNFGGEALLSTKPLTVNVRNLGKTYATGDSDPSITITSVQVVGDNAGEFSAVMPATTLLAPQAQAAVTVNFRPTTKGVKNAALLVSYAGGPSPLRIPLYGIGNDNCGPITVARRIKSAADAAVTIAGNVWEADINFRKGSVKLDRPLPAPAVAGTDDDVLYQTYLSALTDLAETRYEIPVANGNYTVRLHFVENFFTTAGARVFTTRLEGQSRLANFDIFEAAGYRAAVVKDFPVTVADGMLNITFNPSANRVAVAAVEIFNTGAAGGIGCNQAPVAGAGNAQTVTLPTSSVTLTGTGSDPEDGTNVTFAWSQVSGPSTATLATPNAATTQATGLVAGTYSFRLTVTDRQGATATAQVTVTVNSAATACNTPVGWTRQDIGTVGLAGSACQSSATAFTVRGSGADIWGTADQFTYLYQPLGCDGEVVAQLNSLTNTNAWAKAGVMIRESTASNARHAMMVVSSVSGAAFQYRTNTGGTTAGVGTPGALPRWVRLVRAGTLFTGFISPDGVSWQKVGEATIAMNQQVLVGLPVTSHNNTALTTAQFSNVAVTSAGCGTTIVPSATRINAGGAAYTYPAPDSRSFASDRNFSGGTVSTRTMDIPNRTDDALYQNLRYGLSFGYNVPVANGTYDVVLHFAETYWGVNGVAGGIGSRVFSVNVEGQPFLTNFDIIREAGGPLRVVQRTFRVNVTDGVVNLSFFKGAAGVDNATVSAIEVVPVTTARTTVAAAGGAEGELNVRLYPNPTTGKFRVELSGADAGQVTTLLRDALGGERLRNRHKVVGERTLELDVTDQRRGVYLLEVQSGDRRQILKVVKQ